jgi:ubiquitin C-terminal hydrolase
MELPDALYLCRYNYNDSYVSKASTDQLVTPQAYVLFYKRR